MAHREQLPDFPTLRAQAFKRLKGGNRRRATSEEKKYCLELFAGVDPYAVYTVQRDLDVYPIYDALAMWLDKDTGLAYWFPDLVNQAAQFIFKTDEKAPG